MDFNAASEYILRRLKDELNPSLRYHSIGHTMDVLYAVRRLCDMENIAPQSRILIETATLYHDSGMISQYHDHETASVALARQFLPGFGYTDEAIDDICGLIMVTKLPQRPYTHFEQIICDADLDYLGRDDFFIHSFDLQFEWKVNGIRNTTLGEWLEIQKKFLTEHQYFTRSAIMLRNQKKLEHLQELEQLCSRMDSKNNSKGV